MPDWSELSAHASKASHQLIGWIYWDPDAIAAYAALGVPDGTGWYIASRGAPLAAAGHQAVAAAFYSIHPGFIEGALALAAATTWEQITDVRDRAVAAGLRADAPEIVDALAELAAPLWATVDALGRRPAGCCSPRTGSGPDPTTRSSSAWLALNCLREYRGDTHFAVLLAEGLSGVQAGLLHNAYLDYPAEWIPRSRGADDVELTAAMADLEQRGLATDGRVNAEGLALRERIEVRTDAPVRTAVARVRRDEHPMALLELLEPVGPRFMARVDATAGPEWMPAARDRR